MSRTSRDPRVEGMQLEAWVRDFDSWDVCDQATTSLFDRTKYAWFEATAWSKCDEEWVKRPGGERGGDAATRAARWVASAALRELTSYKVRARLEGS